MGKILPEEKIIEEIKDLSTQWLLAPTEETKRQLSSFCMLLLSKQATEGKDIAEVSKQLEQTKRIQERLSDEKL